MHKMIILVLGVCVAGHTFAQPRQSNLAFVDPTIGGVGILLQPTRPTIHLPNSMIRVFPVRKDQLDDQISYFPLTISSHRQPNYFALMPLSGDWKNWRKRTTYDQEITRPYYYSALLDEAASKVEFSPSAHSGYFKFTFTGHQNHYLRMGIANDSGAVHVLGRRAVTGEQTVKGLTAYFYALLNQDIIGVYSPDILGNRTAIIELGDMPQIAEVRYGISFISTEQARLNLEKEIPNWGFKRVVQKAYQIWDKTLSQIEVTGGSDAQKKVFYTSLYRCYERMVNINEFGKYYSAYDHRVHESKEPFYVDNWIWDTYIALEPLQAILNPSMQADKIRSYIKMYEQSGWMPSFALAFGDYPCMTGNHAAAWFTDSWFKGITDFDMEKAYRGLKKNALEATLLPWRNGPATILDSFYYKHGYFPALKDGEKEAVKQVNPFEKRQAVSVTLENSYDDWCLAQLAQTLKHSKDKQLFLERAANYKNVFRIEKGFVWPKDSSGAWIEPFDPKFSGGLGGRSYFTENNAYTYNWDVKHDISGLITLMGGREAAERKLDETFRIDPGRSKYEFWNTFPDATGLVGQFVMGNEPSFHIPYLYNYTGQPWKTQKRIRMLLDTWYNNTLFGIPGDEDGGGMCAFVVFSMMGFFPVTPGIPVYNIGSPVFKTVKIHLANGKLFSINAPGNSDTHKYIRKAKLNGFPLTQPWFTHNALMKGVTITLEMDGQPNKSWGSLPGDAPPSAIRFDVAMYHKQNQMK